MDRTEILYWLRETDGDRLGNLWRRADALRRANVGQQVHLRGLVEFSNECGRQCLYCGLRAGNHRLKRYRMSSQEILSCAHRIVELGYGTIVLQSGEDRSLTPKWLAEVIRRIKTDTPLAITLSLGEKDIPDLELWREAGADRYLLRFETSDDVLYRRIRPPVSDRPAHRIEMLGLLRQLGYEIGSGVMIGIPGQTYEMLARDIELFSELGLDMIGVGPFLPHHDTPLGQPGADCPDDQTPNSEHMTHKVIALSRIVCPGANIPATTALASVNGADGYERGLSVGANVIMPNVTPDRYRLLYEVYPAKACIRVGEEFYASLSRRILSAGRTIGAGRGDSPNFAAVTSGRRIS